MVYVQLNSSTFHTNQVGYSLKAIQTQCTDSGTCMVVLYDEVPQTKLTASGLSQELVDPSVTFIRTK